MSVFDISRGQEADYYLHTSQAPPPPSTAENRQRGRFSQILEERRWAHDALIRRVGAVAAQGFQRDGTMANRRWRSGWRIVGAPKQADCPAAWGELRSSFSVNAPVGRHELFIAASSIDNPPDVILQNQAELAAQFGAGIALLHVTPFGERDLEELSLFSGSFAPQLRQANEVIERIETVFGPAEDLERLRLDIDKMSGS